MKMLQRSSRGTTEFSTNQEFYTKGENCVSDNTKNPPYLKDANFQIHEYITKHSEQTKQRSTPRHIIVKFRTSRAKGLKSFQRDKVMTYTKEWT